MAFFLYGFKQDVFFPANFLQPVGLSGILKIPRTLALPPTPFLSPGQKMAPTGRRCDATVRPPEVSGGEPGSRLNLALVVSRASCFEQE